MSLIDDRLYIDPELVQFYDLENDGGADLDYCIAFAEGALSVLDLGCGTGQVAVAVASGRYVTGVDPAGAMLDVARRRPGGEGVTWVEGDARHVRLGQKFDLVLLTGHAFQVFLTAEDQQAVLATVASHLAPEGRFIFDSRNPAAREWLEWVPEKSQRTVAHPSLGTVRAWNDAAWDEASGVVTYDTFYEAANGRRIHAESKIAFPERNRLAGMLDEAGLAVDRWLGDWHGGPWTPTSREIIPIGRPR
ncbi:SAM-dependent methyltransferase [Mesorhizobium soli]|uniref:class I SAM-dependent methyltransferase n=1 Tax=Pseudaminobacter soli (ex Li et al. 2025) TaxID=1295366 RepID=UPI00247DD7F2|nr:SAM-dependent methyltransferase [Mesorhizobium soli]